MLGELAGGIGVHVRQSVDARPGLAARVLEQWRLLASSGITAEDYYAYALHRPELDWTRKREFIGHKEAWRWQTVLNPPAYHYFTEDKLIFKRYMAHAGLPVPRLLGVLGTAGQAESGEALRSPDDLGRWLASAGAEHFVVKPVLGAQGAGILAVGRRLGPGVQWERAPSGTVTLEEVLDHIRQFPRRSDFMVEERLYPHPQLADLGPGVLHTARILTGLDRDVEVIAAMLRIGTGDTAVDNFAAGNLAAPIDAASGRLGPAVVKVQPLTRLPAHPATRAPIEGRILPDWARVLEVVRHAARVTPFNPVQAWDVGLSSVGPVLVEANDQWDFDALQMCRDRGLLGTSLHTHLERLGGMRMVGLGRWRPR